LVAFTANWRWIGYTAVIYLAGLQSVSLELYDAARVDGATRFNAIVHIVIPLLRPIIVFQVTNGMIGCLKIFEEPYMMFGNYKGGVDNAAQTMNMKYLDTAFGSQQPSYGAAMGYAMFVVILIFTLLYFRIVNRNED
jgi:ABC-type sugar transport system permease subunit